MENMLISFCVPKMINSKWVFAVMTSHYSTFDHCSAELIPLPFSVVHAISNALFHLQNNLMVIRFSTISKNLIIYVAFTIRHEAAHTYVRNARTRSFQHYKNAAMLLTAVFSTCLMYCQQHIKLSKNELIQTHSHIFIHTHVCARTFHMM